MRTANRLAVIVTVATLGLFISPTLAGADVRPKGKARAPRRRNSPVARLPLTCV